MLIRLCQPQSHKFFDFFHSLNPVDISHLRLVFRHLEQQPLSGGKIIQNRL
jgi:hypothetical protein